MKILILLTFIATFSANANPSVHTRVHKVVLDENQSQDALVFSTVDGKVYHIDQSSAHLQTLLLAQETQTPVELGLKNNGTISYVKLFSSEALAQPKSSVMHTSPSPTPTPSATPFVALPPPAYTPTVLTDITVLRKLFKSLTPPGRFYTRSQCYRRAHEWSYDMYKQDKVNSMKAIVFFTTKYIRQYKFDWWFHTAPFIYYKADGVMNEVVFDPTYFEEGGVAVDDWASAFMENGAKCPEIKRYQDYEDHEDKQFCYLRKVPMYFYEPGQVEKMDKENVFKTDFDPADIYDMGTEMYRRKW